MTFTRTKEDFICEHCGTEVKGNGYTNHCTECLWAKHVDVSPGDRAETCGGLMEPIGAEMVKDELILTHECLQCGFLRRNKTSEHDNQDMVFNIVEIK